MKRCKICIMSDLRPGITFNEKGVCAPCIEFERQKGIDWSGRWLELDNLCQKHRKHDGTYDCVICVSGGKDSHYQVHLFREMLGMHPLGIMIDNSSWTQTGRMNYYNLSDRYGIDLLNFTSNRKEMRERTKSDFINYAWPNKLWDEVLYRKPLELAQKLGVKLVIWGENTSLTAGGPRNKETSNAKLLLENPEEFPDLEVIFTSYYVPWSRFYNADLARKNGFKWLSDTGEWNRLGRKGFEFEQVDTIGYEMNNYCKFIKFGFSSITELGSDAVRHGLMTRDEALKRVYEDDWKLDPKMLVDFLKGIGMSESQFWKVIDKHANKEILEKRDGWWQLKERLF